MPKLVRKNGFIEPRALKRAQAILATRGESEAIRKALEIVAFRDEALKGFDRVTGKAPGYGDSWGAA
jgi:hypothetical protein